MPSGVLPLHTKRSALCRVPSPTCEPGPARATTSSWVIDSPQREHVTCGSVRFGRRRRLGPTLSAEELGADKLLALFDRAQARDFVDVAALVDRFGHGRLCELASETAALAGSDRTNSACRCPPTTNSLAPSSSGANASRSATHRAAGSAPGPIATRGWHRPRCLPGSQLRPTGRTECHQLNSPGDGTARQGAGGHRGTRWCSLLSGRPQVRVLSRAPLTWGFVALTRPCGTCAVDRRGSLDPS